MSGRGHSGALPGTTVGPIGQAALDPAQANPWGGDKAWDRGTRREHRATGWGKAGSSDAQLHNSCVCRCGGRCCDERGGGDQGLGLVREARPPAEQALAITEATYGPDHHPTIATALNSLAQNLRGLGLDRS